MADSPLNSDSEFEVDVESKPSEQIPIKSGDVYGWLPDTGPTIYFSDQSTPTVCVQCGTDYYRTPWISPSDPTVGMIFDASSGSGAGGQLDYYIRLLVGPGAKPQFTNLKALTIYDNETVGSLLYTLLWKDDNTLETVTLSVTSIPSAKININVNNGQISVVSDLAGTAGVYTYDLNLSDGCNEIQSSLTITVDSSFSLFKRLPRNKRLVATIIISAIEFFNSLSKRNVKTKTIRKFIKIIFLSIRFWRLKRRIIAYQQPN